jgi:3-phenylpropionate/cinnamic acid dioxygenase small subunit
LMPIASASAQDADWKILRKHVVLLNDKINAVLDFYHV